MKIGLVGKPSAGKSTFFKAATLMDVAIANYPFTTIDPNTGFGHLRIDCADKEFNTTCNPRTGYCVGGQRFVPFELMDVAGLVPDAHLGKGRGLAFLSDLNEAVALIHVIDASGSINAEGEDVEQGVYDPCKDIEFLERELDYWYLGIIKKGWDRFSRKVQQEKLKPELALTEQLSGLRVTEEHVKQALKELSLPEAMTDWSEEDLLKLATYLRKKTKPIVVAANKIDKATSKKHFKDMKNKFPEHIIIQCSSEIELALREAAHHDMISYLPGDKSFTITHEEKLNEKQKQGLSFMKKFLEEHRTTGVQEVLNKAVLELLKYIAVFPVATNKLEDSDGRKLPDCFLMPKTTTPLNLAARLHTDFAKHFIRAVNVRTKLPIAKDEPLHHRDVVEIVSAK